MMMQYDVTGGGPMEVSVVEFSVPGAQIDHITSNMQQNVKNVKVLLSFGCCTVHCALHFSLEMCGVLGF